MEMSKTSGKDLRQRAFELDLVRGLAIIFMVLYHFMWDANYLFGWKVLRFMIEDSYDVFAKTLNLVAFVGVSGICCSFTRSYAKRALKIGICAVGLTIITYIATSLGFDCLIIFNVLHLVTLGIIVLGLVNWIRIKTNASVNQTAAVVGIIGLWIILIGQEIGALRGAVEGDFLIPFGILGDNILSMADYMPIFPWLGVFMVGAVIGMLCYSEKRSLWPNAPEKLRKVTRPIEFLGRYSLVVYIVHQPVLLLMLVLLKTLGLI